MTSNRAVIRLKLTPGCYLSSDSSVITTMNGLFLMVNALLIKQGLILYQSHHQGTFRQPKALESGTAENWGTVRYFSFGTENEEIQ